MSGAIPIAGGCGPIKKVKSNALAVDVSAFIRSLLYITRYIHRYNTVCALKLG